MKFFKFVLSCCIFFCLFFASCSGSQQNDIVYYNDDTLRSVTDKIESELLWTREIEGVRLLKDISKNEGAAQNMRLTCPAMCMVSSSDYGEPVYPVLPGFSSLNTSLLLPSLRSFLDGFCSSLTKWKLDTSSFESSSIFSLALFKYDVETQWKDFFAVDFPELQSENESSKDAADSKTPSEDEPLLFSRWLYGEPFFDEETVEIPVRFYVAKGSGSIDVLLFVSKETEKLNQIQIQRWNKGKK